MSDNQSMEETLSRVAETAKVRAQADRAFRAAVLAAHKQGASLREIRDASGGLISHEQVRRLVAAAVREGGK